MATDGHYAGGIDTLYGGDGDDILDGGRFTYAAGFSSPPEKLYGEAGNDILFGAGGQAMYGGTGNDTFYVNTPRGEIAGYNIPEDQVFEVEGEGFDTVYVWLSHYALPEGQSIERLIADPDRPNSNTISITGNSFGQELIGDDLTNTLDGAGGNDVLRGGGGPDWLYGGSGDDILIGGAGDDRMEGGEGSDTYYVDSAADVVLDPAAPGVDRIAASVSYTLRPDADIEILEAVNSSSTAALNFTGNGFGQAIIGNAGANVLRGEGGNDELVGLAGDDVLIGGIGIDVMRGGSGSDTYYVDHHQDMVDEPADIGDDRVATSVSYSLPDGADIELFEAITLSATNALDLIGNQFGQTIVGNNGANFIAGRGGSDVLWAYGGDDILDGGTGDDVMHGGAGNDTYYVDSSGDRVVEAQGEGHDRIATSVSIELGGGSEIEVLEAVNLSGTAPINLTGSDHSNRITGNAGSNLINGRGGSDVLVGGAGADTFEFTTALGAGNVDRIVDFEVSADRIALGGTNGQPFGALPPGQLAPSAFATGTEATSASHRIIYNPATGALFYDSDGSGGAAAVQFATLSPNLALTASHFTVAGGSGSQQAAASNGEEEGDRFAAGDSSDEPAAMRPALTVEDACLPCTDYFIG